MADGINTLGGRWVQTKPSKSLMPELSSPEEMQERIQKLEETVESILTFLSGSDS